MIVRLPLLPILLVSLMPVSAGTGDKSHRQARILAVGELPPFRQEIRDGIRFELDPPAGSIPPREVIPAAGDEKSDAIPLRLGMITGPVKVPSGEGVFTLQRAGDAEDAAAWVKVNRPEEGDFLIYLFRSPRHNTWDHVVGLVVPDGEGTPAGKVRITNLFPQSVRIVWGKEAALLESGKSILRDAKPGTEVAFLILAQDSSGNFVRYYSGGVGQNPGERGWVTIYRADGVSPRRPLKVSMLREPVKALKPKIGPP